MESRKISPANAERRPKKPTSQTEKVSLGRPPKQPKKWRDKELSPRKLITLPWIDYLRMNSLVIMKEDFIESLGIFGNLGWVILIPGVSTYY
jgi:hypothetical protein